jgi:hypothetical protein
VSKYLRSTLFETTFDGDKVSVMLKPIKQRDALRLFAASKAPEADGASLLSIYAELVPIYAEDLNGLRASDGTAVSMSEVTRDMYFSSLLIEIGNALIATGKPVDPKAPASQPAAISQA